MISFRKQKDRKIKEDELLLRQIKSTQDALTNVYLVFDHVTEPDLIDSSIYELNSLLLRYKFLMETAKKRGCCRKFRQDNLELPVYRSENSLG